MKTSLFPTLGAAVAVLLSSPALAEDPPPPVPKVEAVAPGPPKPPRPRPVPPPEAPIVPDLAPMLSDIQLQLQQQLSQVGAAVNDIVTRAPNADLLLRGAPRPGRTLVISADETDSRTLGNVEKDLNVMARILEKALASEDDSGDQRRAMGIAVSSSPIGAPRNLYLDGYGALFFLDVNFPLLPPPRKDEKVKAKDPVSSDWEEAERELEGGRSPEWRLSVPYNAKSALRAGTDYDAEKVERLKDAILESLKNATHIRDLKPAEFVTVVVSGGATGRFERQVTRKSGSGAKTSLETRAYVVEARSTAARNETTMTMRAKKADADAFAKGELSLDEFRKRVSTRSY